MRFIKPKVARAHRGLKLPLVNLVSLSSFRALPLGILYNTFVLLGIRHSTFLEGVVRCYRRDLFLANHNQWYHHGTPVATTCSLAVPD